MGGAEGAGRSREDGEGEATEGEGEAAEGDGHALKNIPNPGTMTGTRAGCSGKGLNPGGGGIGAAD